MVDKRNVEILDSSQYKTRVKDQYKSDILASIVSLAFAIL